MSVESSGLFDNSAYGLSVVTAGVALISNVTVIGNATGLHNSGGTMKSFGNNKVENNTTNLSGLLDPVGQM